MCRNVLTGTVLILACTFLAMSVVAEPPQYINYQGRLTDDAGEPITNTSPGVMMTFTIWNDESLSDPGNFKWSVIDVLIPVEDGLFEYQLGPLQPNLFRDNPDLWLGISVEGDPEIDPRTKLVSAAYACHAGTVDDIYIDETGDIMAGDLILDFQRYGQYDGLIDVAPGYANIELYSNENLTTKVWGQAWGEVDLYSEYSIGPRVELVGHHDGGILNLYKGTGPGYMTLDAMGVGDNSAILYNDAINADEILDEPGICSNFSTGNVGLYTASTMTDLLTISIDIPSAGYIRLDGWCRAEIYDATDYEFIHIQIDETSGGGLDIGHSIAAGRSDFIISDYYHCPMYVSRVYYKDAGTYTFRLEGMIAFGNGTGKCWYPNIIATYYPTSYAGVKAVTSAPGDYPDPVAVNAVDPITKTETTVYEIDLRYYEQKAKDARIKALEAELELRQKQLEAARQSTGRENGQ